MKESNKKIPTLSGKEISVNDFSFTLPHEHLLFAYDEKYVDKCIEYTRAELKRLYKNGGKTVVDLTPFRPIDIYKKMSEGIDLNIICSTGYYTEIFVREIMKRKDLLNKSIEYYTDKMLREITEGIDGTNIRAGVIKVAGDQDSYLTDWESKVFTAAAKASVKTKTPIATHAIRGAAAQQKQLIEAGANPEHIFLSHVEAEAGWEGRNVHQQAEHLLDIVKRGTYLLFNNFGYWFDTSRKNLFYIIKYIANKGYLNKILISVDMFYHLDDNGTILLRSEEEYPEVKIKVYSYVFYEIIPELKEMGFSEKEINKIFFENPIDFFNYQ